MDAIHAAAPGALFLLQGAGQQGLGANWGDGFCCDPALVRSHGLSDPNPLVCAILQKPYRDQATPLGFGVWFFVLGVKPSRFGCALVRVDSGACSDRPH